MTPPLRPWDVYNLSPTSFRFFIPRIDRVDYFRIPIGIDVVPFTCDLATLYQDTLKTIHHRYEQRARPNTIILNVPYYTSQPVWEQNLKNTLCQNAVPTHDKNFDAFVFADFILFERLATLYWCPLHHVGEQAYVMPQRVLSLEPIQDYLRCL